MTTLDKSERYPQMEEDRNRLADAIHPGWSEADPSTRPSINKLVDKANFGRGLSEHARGL